MKFSKHIGSLALFEFGIFMEILSFQDVLSFLFLFYLDMITFLFVSKILEMAPLHQKSCNLIYAQHFLSKMKIIRFLFSPKQLL